MTIHNSTIEFLTTAIIPYIKDESIPYTNEHSSYSAVARSPNFRYNSVNHSEGFGFADGTHQH